MFKINKVILIGRLTKDPELKYAPGSDNAVASMTLAVDRKVKKEGQPEADFINCVAFGKTAEIMAQYLTKGRLVGVSGNIRTGSYEAKDGTKRYTTDVYIEEFQFLEKGNKPSVENTDFGVPVESGDLEQINGDIPF